MNAIEIYNVTKDYRNRRGVFDVSFCVKPGEIMGFLGPNGAGKTTTIRQLLGFIRPDRGYLRILGKDCFSQADEIAGLLGYLPGEIAFIDSMTGTEFIRFTAQMKGMKDLGRAPELMESFELDARGKLKRMSKGMKQKIGIICAFMQDPDILILDEPTSGLDPLMQRTFVDLLLEEKRRGKTILMSSHMFEEMEKTCDRVAMIREGKLLSVENIENLKNGRKKIIQLTLKNSADAASLNQKLTANDFHSQAEGVHVTAAVGGSNGHMDRFLKLAGSYTILDLDIRTQGLEELFIQYYSKSGHNTGSPLSGGD